MHPDMIPLTSWDQWHREQQSFPLSQARLPSPTEILTACYHLIPTNSAKSPPPGSPPHTSLGVRDCSSGLSPTDGRRETRWRGLGQRLEVRGRVPAFSRAPFEGGYCTAVMKPTAFRFLPLGYGAHVPPRTRSRGCARTSQGTCVPGPRKLHRHAVALVLARSRMNHCPQKCTLFWEQKTTHTLDYCSRQGTQ